MSVSWLIGLAIDLLIPDRKKVNVQYKRHDYLALVESFSTYLN